MAHFGLWDRGWAQPNEQVGDDPAKRPRPDLSARSKKDRKTLRENLAKAPKAGTFPKLGTTIEMKA